MFTVLGLMICSKLFVLSNVSASVVIPVLSGSIRKKGLGCLIIDILLAARLRFVQFVYFFCFILFNFPIPFFDIKVYNITVMQRPLQQLN